MIYLFSDDALCTMFSGCEISHENCPHCLSGQKSCPPRENQCWVNGICEGILVNLVLDNILNIHANPVIFGCPFPRGEISAYLVN